VRLVVALLTAAALAPSAAAAPLPDVFPLTLHGVAREHAFQGNEVDELVAYGGDAAFVLHETIECATLEADCAQLHRGAPGRVCEGTYGRATLRLTGGRLHLMLGGEVCPGRHAHEHGLALVTSGRGALRGVRGLLHYRIVRTERGRGRIREVVTLRDVVATAASTDCTLCMFINETLHSWLAQGLTESEITHRLERAGRSLPGSYSRRCIEMVDEFLPYWLHYARQGHGARYACQQTGTCET
jgi:hypothetical protein